MKRFEIRATVYLNALLTIEAETEEKALEIAREQMDSEEVMDEEIMRNDYYNGYDFDVIEEMEV